MLVRLINFVLEKLNELTNRFSEQLPGGTKSLVVLVIVVVGGLALLGYRLRPVRRGGGAGAMFASGQPLTARAHRDLAEQAAARGAYAEAVRERLRAVVRTLEADGVLDSRPGRTAGEVVRDASSAVPHLADALRRGTLVFDEIWYGGRVADAASYAVLVEVDRLVLTRRPVPT